MSWWKRIREGINTSTREKKEAPDGVWYQCPSCKKTITVKEHTENFWVCPECDHHERIEANEYFEILFNSRYREFFGDLISKDFLEFKDLKTYQQRLEDAARKTGEKEAIKVAQGKVFHHRAIIAAMNFKFIGGSMGSVVGEKIAMAVDQCLEKKIPLIIISKSGGARMMESAFSLMQMAKTSAKLSQLSEAKIPYISILTDPTTGGVTASFAMLGDINIAEPKALIGFAGPRVIKETIKKDLPEGFQRSEFLLEHGFVDLIVERKNLKQKLSDILDLLKA
ncbi:MAG: acetyl-CoA carboxylase carboxyltransferase subunit beta [Bacteroidia bacterium]|nr:acetyl-CoA carboxylase carboxyltransferase subunit beta [Bacteroidia bacterium]